MQGTGEVVPRSPGGSPRSQSQVPSRTRSLAEERGLQICPHQTRGVWRFLVGSQPTAQDGKPPRLSPLGAPSSPRPRTHLRPPYSSSPVQPVRSRARSPLALPAVAAAALDVRPTLRPPASSRRPPRPPAAPSPRPDGRAACAAGSARAPGPDVRGRGGACLRGPPPRGPAWSRVQGPSLSPSCASPAPRAARGWEKGEGAAEGGEEEFQTLVGLLRSSCEGAPLPRPHRPTLGLSLGPFSEGPTAEGEGTALDPSTSLPQTPPVP